MLTRRGFASCALCAITGFMATEASAQGSPPPSGGVNRKILSKSDGPAPGYETLLVEAEIEPGISVLSIRSSSALERNARLAPRRALRPPDIVDRVSEFSANALCETGQTTL